jgi:hypothetical protein
MRIIVAVHGHECISVAAVAPFCSFHMLHWRQNLNLNGSVKEEI